MKVKQTILLLIALLLPIAIFIFLKSFGRNEFNVAPMFQEELPAAMADCSNNTRAPYSIEKAELEGLELRTDSLTVIHFSTDETAHKSKRVKDQYSGAPLQVYVLPAQQHAKIQKCIFLLAEPFDAVLVDSKRRIRGQYDLKDRDEVDRLITEVAIIFKQY
jgi:hypothetical protein